MKLRNKKTGEIIEYSIGLNQWSEDEQEWFLFGNYDSIDELKEDWEEYKPTEPLIKDEKIRKAVKAWAEANGDDCYYIVSAYQLNDGSGYSIEFYYDPFDGLEKRHYTIRELCGDD